MKTEEDYVEIPESVKAVHPINILNDRIVKLEEVVRIHEIAVRRLVWFASYPRSKIPEDIADNEKWGLK